MEQFLEVLKYVAPSVVVFGTAYYLIKMMLNSEANKRKTEITLANRKQITPTRLQAYERLALYLERISPDALLIRTQKKEMNTRQLQLILLNTIRKEFEHNLSQQIYISSQAWEAVVSAKENMVKIINNVADTVKPDEPAMELTKKIMNVMMKVETTPTKLALEILKNEVRTFF